MTSPLFSIVTPAYNASKTLHRCAESILTQSFCDWEWIVIDDGSQDDTLPTIEAMGKSIEAAGRVISLHQQNTGPSAARNNGLYHAKGEYILFMDADDFFPDANVLFALSRSIVRHPDADLFYFSGYVQHTNGTKDVQRYIPRVYGAGWQCMEEYCCKALYIVFGALYAQCYKRTLLQENLIHFREDIVYGEDRLFVTTCFMHAGETVVLDNPLYVYVVADGSLMHDLSRKQRVGDDIHNVLLGIESEMFKKQYHHPQLHKYIHQMYVCGIQKKHTDIDWRFLFRHASTWKLKLKDILLFCGINKY